MSDYIEYKQWSFLGTSARRLDVDKPLRLPIHWYVTLRSYIFQLNGWNDEHKFVTPA
jgi:hypothetical protein